MGWPVKQQLFLKTSCGRAAGLEEERCQALVWMKPLGKGWSLLSVRTSAQHEKKPEGF